MGHRAHEDGRDSRRSNNGLDSGNQNWLQEYRGRGRGIRSTGSQSGHRNNYASSPQRTHPYVKRERISEQSRKNNFNKRYEESSAQEKRLQRFKDVLSIGSTVVAKGSVFECFRGSFATVSSAIIKQVPSERKLSNGYYPIDLADNEADMLYEFGNHSNIARLLYRGTYNGKAQIIMEQYGQNMESYLDGRSRRHSGFHIPMEDIAKQLLETLHFLEHKRIAHQDLRLKNLYIERTYGKFLRGWLCMLFF